MTQKNCAFDLEEREGELWICVRGEMDHHSAVALRVELDKILLEKKPRRAVLNLSEIGFMDSSGLGFVMGRYSFLQKLGGELVLEDPNERVARIFALAGLERIIKIQKNDVEKEKVK